MTKRMKELYSKLVLTPSEEYKKWQKKTPRSEQHKLWAEYKKLQKQHYWGGPKRPYHILKSKR